MRVAIVAALVGACGASSPSVVENRSQAGSAAPAPDPEPTLACAGLGARIGPLGGPTGGGGPKAREHAIAVMCTKEGWSHAVLDCAIENEHSDPMACLRRPFLTEGQNARWNDTFNAWFL